jgi:hypothetical protein
VTPMARLHPASPSCGPKATSSTTCGGNAEQHSKRSPVTATPHGDLSAYNVLVHRGRLVLIDLPQVVDIVGNPQGATYLQRDCDNICRWFAARGQPDANPGELAAALATEAGI